MSASVRPKVTKELGSLANPEKWKAQILQIQTELNDSKQAFEKFKGQTGKKIARTGVRVEGFAKSKPYSCKALDATKTCKWQAVS